MNLKQPTLLLVVNSQYTSTSHRWSHEGISPSYYINFWLAKRQGTFVEEASIETMYDPQERDLHQRHVQHVRELRDLWEEEMHEAVQKEKKVLAQREELMIILLYVLILRGVKRGSRKSQYVKYVTDTQNS